MGRIKKEQPGRYSGWASRQQQQQQQHRFAVPAAGWAGYENKLARDITEPELRAKLEEIRETCGTRQCNDARREVLGAIYKSLDRTARAESRAREAGKPEAAASTRAMLTGIDYCNCYCGDPRSGGAEHPVVRLHGTTAFGKSVAVRVHGVVPYLYADLSRVLEKPQSAPPWIINTISESRAAYDAEKSWLLRDRDAQAASEIDVDIAELCKLDATIAAAALKVDSERQQRYRGASGQRQQQQQQQQQQFGSDATRSRSGPTIKTMVGASILWSKSYYGNALCPMLRLRMTHAQLVPAARRAFEEGESMWDGCPKLPPYESDIEYVNRALVDLGLSGGDWFDVLIGEPVACEISAGGTAKAVRFLAAACKEPKLGPWFGGFAGGDDAALEYGDWRDPRIVPAARPRVGGYKSSWSARPPQCEKFFRTKDDGTFNVAGTLGKWWSERTRSFCTADPWMFDPLSHSDGCCDEEEEEDRGDWTMDCGDDYYGSGGGGGGGYGRSRDAAGGGGGLPVKRDDEYEHRVSACIAIDAPSPDCILALGSGGSDELSAIADIRTLSFDIECAGPEGRFPDASEDPVITICASIYDRGAAEAAVARGAARYAAAVKEAKKIEDKELAEAAELAAEKLKVEPGSPESCPCSVIYMQLGPFDAVDRRGASSDDSDARACGTVAATAMPGRSGDREPAPRIYRYEQDGTFSASVSFATEIEMLLAFRDLVMSADPDVIIGYNNCGFDFKYLFARAEALGIKERFSSFARYPHDTARMTSKTLTTRAFGSNEINGVACSGRVVLDLLQIVKRDIKLRSYTLNYVGAKIVESQKEDLPHKKILPCFMASDETVRSMLARYCATDTTLPLRIASKLLVETNVFEMCRATGVYPDALYSRGQSIKTMRLIYGDCSRNGCVVPTRSPASPFAAMRNEEPEGKYEGAIVVHPERGYHDEIVATLDFAALYPSIMIAHNLCFATYLPISLGSDRAASATTLAELDVAIARALPSVAPELRPRSCDVEVSPDGFVFLRASAGRGSLPRILEDVLARRKIAKNLLFAAQERKDKTMSSVFDARQLALKIVANSIYGFTGDRNGKLPCSAIARSVTSYGREMIQITIDTARENYKAGPVYKFDPKDPASRATPLVHDGVALSCPADARVLYGDTDSIMFSVGMKITDDMKCVVSRDKKTGKKKIEITEPYRRALRQMMQIGMDAAARVTAKFVRPIAIVFEKLLAPYLLINKKRYAALYFEYGDKLEKDKPASLGVCDPKIFVRGLESVRRDNCMLVPETIDQVLDLLIVHRDPAAALRYVARRVRDLRRGNVSIGKLIITKQYSKETKAYDGKQVHVEIVKRARKRDAANAPKLGDRVKFVYVCRDKRAKAFERGEDPVRVIAENEPIDHEYYVMRQLARPLCRIFVGIVSDAPRLFDRGDRMIDAVCDAGSGSGGGGGGTVGADSPDDLAERARAAIRLARGAAAALRRDVDRVKAGRPRIALGVLASANVGLYSRCAACGAKLCAAIGKRYRSGAQIAASIQRAIDDQDPTMDGDVFSDVDIESCSTATANAAAASAPRSSCAARDGADAETDGQEVPGILCRACAAPCGPRTVPAHRMRVSLLRSAVAREQREIDAKIAELQAKCAKCHATATGDVRAVVGSGRVQVEELPPGPASAVSSASDSGAAKIADLSRPQPPLIIASVERLLAAGEPARARVDCEMQAAEPEASPDDYGDVDASGPHGALKASLSALLSALSAHASGVQEATADTVARMCDRVAVDATAACGASSLDLDARVVDGDGGGDGGGGGDVVVVGSDMQVDTTGQRDAVDAAAVAAVAAAAASAICAAAPTCASMQDRLAAVAMLLHAAKDYTGEELVFTMADLWDGSGADADKRQQQQQQQQKQDHNLLGRFRPASEARGGCDCMVDLEDLLGSCSNTDCETFFERIRMRVDKVAAYIVAEALRNTEWHTAMRERFVAPAERAAAARKEATALLSPLDAQQRIKLGAPDRAWDYDADFDAEDDG
jgi:DNA polymerase elongation subunit (family B)